MNIKITFALIIAVLILGAYSLTKDTTKDAQTINTVNSLVNNEEVLAESENTVVPVQKEEIPMDLTIDQTKNYEAVLTTSMGDIKINLFEKEAPITVNNFVKLAKEGFYDGLIFHRVIPDFMIQGGDPTGTGTGGPGYKFEDEITGKPIVKGTLAMANSGPNTNGSQFFIVTAEETPWLNNLHTNFGEVIEGLEIVDQISLVETNSSDKPLTNVVIEKIVILEN